MRKILTKCTDYENYFDLQCLLLDIWLTKRISAVVNVADQRDIAPDEPRRTCNSFLGIGTVPLREAHEYVSAECVSNLFLTVATAEWQFPSDDGFVNAQNLQDSLFALTLHAYQTIRTQIDVLSQGDIWASAKCIEFQDRSTLHLHVVAWIRYQSKNDDSMGNFAGRTGTQHSSPCCPPFCQNFSNVAPTCSVR